MLTLLLLYPLIQPAQVATAQVTLVGDKVQTVQANPGERYTGAVMVHNELDTPLTIRIYQDEITALTSYDRGDKIVTINRSNAGWVQHATERMVLQAGEVAAIDFEVDVPEVMAAEGSTGHPTGTYWSSLSVDVIALGDKEFRKPYSRHHLAEVATHITDTGETNLAINAVKLVGGTDGKTLQAMMVNTGDLLVKPEVWIELYDTAGNLQERIPGATQWIFPGGFDRVSADLANVKPGVYEAQLVVDAGKDHIFGDSYTLDMTGLGSVAHSRLQKQKLQY